MAFSSLLMAKKKTQDLNPIVFWDSYVNSSFPNTNYWTAETLFCRSNNSSEYWSYFKWDISSLPSNPTTVELFFYTFSSKVNNSTENIYIVTSWNWNENTITYSNKPFWTLIWTIPFQPWANWNSVDITWTYNNWKDLISPNYWVKVSWWLTNWSYYTAIYSKESAFKPYLKITL